MRDLIVCISFALCATGFLVTFRQTYIHQHLFNLSQRLPGLSRLVGFMLLKPEFRSYADKDQASTIMPDEFDAFVAVSYRSFFSELFTCMYCLSWHVGLWAGVAAALVTMDWLAVPTVIGLTVLGRHLVDKQ